MYLSKLTVNTTRLALGWLANPYRVHQRLMMACGTDPRMLFRIENETGPGGATILVQTQTAPAWPDAFAHFSALARPPEMKRVDLQLTAGLRLRFRLVANPTVKRAGARLGLLNEVDQCEWLERKLSQSGARLLACQARPLGMQHSHKTVAAAAGTAADAVPGIEETTRGQQSHFMAAFDGLLRVEDAQQLAQAVYAGIGPAKGFGGGLLSLAPAANS